MRKMMKLIITMSVILLSLVGCASDSTVKTTDGDATTMEDVSTEQNVVITEDMSDNESMDATEEKETEEESATETVVEEELPIPYDVILNNIYEALQFNPATDEINCVHFSTGISEVVRYGDTVDDRMKAIAYRVMDVNEDGVEELLIVDTVYPEPGNVRILDMYTLVEGTPVKVIEGWARNRYYLLDDGKIYCSSSGGASFSNEELLSFAPGEIKLTSEELYFTYPKDGDWNNEGYYYSANGVYDASVATEISADEFRSFINDCESRMVKLGTKTFDLFITADHSSDNMPQEEQEASQNTQAQIEESVNTNVDDLLDKFLAGEINADGNGLYWKDLFNIFDLPVSGEDWFSYSVGERLDLDNDGENEQILEGPYGGMYLDASDEGVKVFADGNGTANTLSYTNCDNERWIVYSDIMHVGREYYKLEKYSGADTVTESVTLAIFEEDEIKRYYVNGDEVSESKYNELYQKFFGE